MSPLEYLKPRLDALGVRPAVREAIAKAIKSGKIRAVWNPVIGDYEFHRGPNWKPKETGGEPEESPRAD